MSLVVSKPARLVFLEAMFGWSPIRELTLRLYKNDRVPTESSGEEDFAEADFLGYEAQELKNWKLDSLDPPTVAHEQVGFRSSTDQKEQKIFGYFVTGNADKLFWAERFPGGPYSISMAGDEIRIISKFQLE